MLLISQIVTLLCSIGTSVWAYGALNAYFRYAYPDTPHRASESILAAILAIPWPLALIALAWLSHGQLLDLAAYGFYWRLGDGGTPDRKAEFDVGLVPLYSRDTVIDKPR